MLSLFFYVVMDPKKQRIAIWVSFSVYFPVDELPDWLCQHGVLWPPGEDGAGRGGLSYSSGFCRIRSSKVTFACLVCNSCMSVD